MAVTLLIKTRKQIMKDAGFYKGTVDSKKDDAYLKAILAVNKKYLPSKYHTSTVYADTDIILRNLRCIHSTGVKNFKLEEFKCNCNGKYCNGYPAVLKKNLLIGLQEMRDELGPMNISSGMRCKKYNASISGSVSNSAHLKAAAADFWGTCTDTKSKRNAAKKLWKKQQYAGYTYSDTENMGIAVHVEVTK